MHKTAYIGDGTTLHYNGHTIWLTSDDAGPGPVLTGESIQEMILQLADWGVMRPCLLEKP